MGWMYDDVQMYRKEWVYGFLMAKMEKYDGSAVSGVLLCFVCFRSIPHCWLSGLLHTTLCMFTNITHETPRPSTAIVQPSKCPTFPSTTPILPPPQSISPQHQKASLQSSTAYLHHHSRNISLGIRLLKCTFPPSLPRPSLLPLRLTGL